MAAAAALQTPLHSRIRDLRLTNAAGPSPQIERIGVVINDWMSNLPSKGNPIGDLAKQYSFKNAMDVLKFLDLEVDIKPPFATNMFIHLFDYERSNMFLEEFSRIGEDESLRSENFNIRSYREAAETEMKRNETLGTTICFLMQMFLENQSVTFYLNKHDEESKAGVRPDVGVMLPVGGRNVKLMRGRQRWGTTRMRVSRSSQG